MMLTAFIGERFSRRARLADEDARTDFGTVQSASLTLLALIIGFSLSMAVGRYDQRKNYEEEEANAIGTEYIRADLLSAPQAEQMRTALKQYLQQRILFYTERDDAALAGIDQQTARLQDAIWQAAREGVKSGPNPVSALAVAGANDVINTQGYTQAAWWNRIPRAAWALMILLGLFCSFLVGYGARGSKAKGWLLAVMPLTVALSFMLIADIDSPRAGIIRVVPQNLHSLAASLHTS